MHVLKQWRLAAACAFLVASGSAVASDVEAKLNQMQVIGTHNSYHVAPCRSILNLIAGTSPKNARSLDYTHAEFERQFSDQTVRQIELDVFNDSKGGLFARPYVRKLLSGRQRDPGPDPNATGVLDRPGLKVLHVQDIDYMSRAFTFTDALRQVRAWSKSHPRHVPIMILVELKDDSIALLPTKPLRFDKERLDAVDEEIASVFERDEVLAPDDIRGDSETLPAALRTRGWPTLTAVRGKVMFALDNEGAIRDRYLDGHDALRGRLMFASVDRDHPAAAWMKVNDAMKDFERIRTLVRDGFMVRTRADVDGDEARRPETTRRDRALASGAQFVSTDFPVPRRELSDYCVRFGGGVVARPNPVSAAGLDLSRDLEPRD